MNFRLRMTLAFVGLVVFAIAASTFNLPFTQTIQRGYRGLGMVQVSNNRDVAASLAAMTLPPPSEKLDPSGMPASAVYQNVQVLKDVDSNEFLRLMNDITAWVSPQQGCNYCHAEGEELSSDKLYTKVVARRMIQMVRHINSGWKSHVADTGVTCYTCHFGQPVPTNIWYNTAGPDQQAAGSLGNKGGQNTPLQTNGFTSLPYDPFTPFFDHENEIRVVSSTALPEGNRRSIKQTEWTYSLMVHISKALGVNCTFCHNSRSFFDWDQSTPQRAIAWYGIRMVRDLNLHFLDPLTSQFPPERLGLLGDGPKLNCATCHRGAYKPLFGYNLVHDYPELATETADTSATPAAPAPAGNAAPAAPAAPASSATPGSAPPAPAAADNPAPTAPAPAPTLPTPRTSAPEAPVAPLPATPAPSADTPK